MKNLVIIPTYNEIENIEAIIKAVFNLPVWFDVLIVDDGSPDGTATIVKSLFSKFPGQLFLEERKGKLGLGTAYIHGFKWALANGFAFESFLEAMGCFVKDTAFLTYLPGTPTIFFEMMPDALTLL